MHTAVKSGKDYLLSGIMLIAWCSGCASLIYQINWQRQLTTIFGLAHYATTLTILVFFVGFALGAYLAKRYSDRLQQILILIVGLEVIIGVFGAVSFYVFDLLRTINGAMSMTLADASGALLSARVVLCLAFLLIPTVCMGATLPCFYKACIKSPDLRGSRIGWITGANTLGALAGSIGTTWLLMGHFSGQAQMFIAAAFNLVSAVAASFLLGYRFPSAEPKKASRTEVHADSVRPKSSSLMYAFMLSGAASLGLQIVWNRLAYMSLEHTIFTFALVLSVYLAAYTAGVFCSGLWLRRHVARRGTAALLQLAGLGFTLTGFLLFANGLHHDVLLPQFDYQVAALIVVSSYAFLPMFFIGLSMPIVLQLLSGEVARLGRDTSRALMMNNIGSIVAIVVVGFFLIPMTNLHLVMLFCVLLLAGAVLLTAGRPRSSIQWRISYPIAALPIAVLFWLHPLDPYETRHLIRYDEQPIWSEEDESGYWAVYLQESQSGKKHYLYLNDSYENYLQSPDQGTIEGDFLLAAMVKPEIRSAYSIGLGLALEPYELLRFPELERFTTVEISPASISLAKKVWGEYKLSPFDDPRFEVILEDGRIWLQHQPRRFDLILSGTNRSFYPGSTNLFSVEYLQLLKSKLNPGGVVQQWIPRSPKHQSVVLVKTFLSVFPDALLVEYRDPGRRSPYLHMLAFADGTPRDIHKQIQAAFNRAPEIFSSAVISSPERFLTRLRIPKREALERLDVPLVYDDLPVVEYDRSSEALKDWTELSKFTQPYNPVRLRRYLQSTPRP